MREMRTRGKSIIRFVAAVSLSVSVWAGCVFAAGNDYVHYRLGVKYRSENKYDQAIEEFRRVLAAYPDHYNAYMNIAEIRIIQGRYRLALFNLKKSLTF